MGDWIFDIKMALLGQMIKKIDIFSQNAKKFDKASLLTSCSRYMLRRSRMAREGRLFGGEYPIVR